MASSKFLSHSFLSPVPPSEQSFSVHYRAPNAFFFDFKPTNLVINSLRTAIQIGPYTLSLKNLTVSPGLYPNTLVLCNAAKIITIRIPSNAKPADWPALTRALELATHAPPGYIYLSEIARGAFGTVYRAMHRNTLALVAIKHVCKSTLRLPLPVARRELSILSSLPSHPHVVPILATFETRHALHLVMPLARTTLLDMLPTGLSGHVLRKVARQLLSAVAHLHHNGLLHRDIKPDNVLVSEGNSLHIWLCDFGLAVAGKGRATVGTGYGQAPEVILGGGASYGPGVDVWGCGVVLFALRLGRIPWGRDRVSRDADLRRMVHLASRGQQCLDVMLMEGESCHDVKELLMELLQPLPGRRLTARAALEHHYFKGNDAGDCDASTPRAWFANVDKDVQVLRQASDVGDLVKPERIMSVH